MMLNKVIVKDLFIKLVFILTMHSQGVILQQCQKTMREEDESIACEKCLT